MKVDEEMPKILYGDEDRLKYIFTCLLKNSVERNREVCTLKGASLAVDLNVCVSPEEKIEFSDDYETFEGPY